jgi:ribosomal protein S20
MAMCLLAFGCGKSADQGATQGSPAGANAAAPTPDVKTVVTSFLEALRKGDNDAATKLLSKVARQKAEASGKCVAPPPSESAKIEVEEATYPDREIAHVPTKWIDLDETGKPRSDRAILVCRLEPEGWRVAAFAAYVFEGEDPLLLNFEDLEDMAKKQTWLKEEIARRAKQATIQSADAENSVPAEKKPQDAFRR